MVQMVSVLTLERQKNLRSLMSRMTRSSSRRMTMIWTGMSSTTKVSQTHLEKEASYWNPFRREKKDSKDEDDDDDWHGGVGELVPADPFSSS